MTAKYQAFLQSRDGQLNYGETALPASSDDEAKQQAKDWAVEFQPVADDVVLIISDGPRGVGSFKSGQF